jgi:DNA polymerase III subunit chi
MSEANFYELTKTPFFKALPKLIESVSSKGNNVLILCKNEEEVREFDNLLWTYEQLSFLPHVTNEDPDLSDTPVVISTRPINDGRTFVLVSASLFLPNDLSTFSKILVMYRKDNPEQIDQANCIETDLKNKSYKINKFIQNSSGSWEKNV